MCRSVENRKKAEFFKRDFTQEESRRVAKKNAFHLMGKQKFYDSAALFLLSGSLYDAVMVSHKTSVAVPSGGLVYADQLLEL